ncbi:hypothetical protein ACFE04_003874 [Oxalis oulophora]
MDQHGTVTIYNHSTITDTTKTCPFSIKANLAQILRGGAIFEVNDPQQAKIAEQAGACSVVVSEKQNGGVWRMPEPSLVKEIKRVVSIPVIACVRVGHFVEAQIMESIGVDYIDESEILSIADEDHFINKQNFRTPFVCGTRNLGDALRRIREGAAIVRIQGELSNWGDIAKTVKNVRSVMGDIRVLNNIDKDEVFAFAKKIAAPYEMVVQTKQMGRLPVVQFAAGGIVTPADAALMMQLGCDGVFLKSEVFECRDPYKRACGIVQAVRHYNDSHMLAEISCRLEDDAGMNVNKDMIEQFGHSEA